MQTHAYDPVCGKRVNRNKAHITVEYKGARYYLCCPHCQSSFERDPLKYVRPKTPKRSSKHRVR